VEVKKQPEEPNEPIVVAKETEFKRAGKWRDALWCADAWLKLRKARIAYRVTEIPKPVGYQMSP